jgi:hypothetical protein
MPRPPSPRPTGSLSRKGAILVRGEMGLTAPLFFKNKRYLKVEENGDWFIKELKS